MSARVYLHPISLVTGPQVEEGAAIRLAGTMAYASRFALVVRENGKPMQRVLFGARGLEAVLTSLDPELAEEAQRQWANLQKVHQPLQAGERTIRLDQPQVMGVLNVTPDSFSDGGEFLERPDAGRAHAAGSLGLDGKTGSIHGLGKDLQAAPSCNGWTFWHYEVDQDVKPVDHARQIYLLANED